MALRRTGTDQIKAVFVFTGDGEFRFNTACRSQGMGEGDSPFFLRQPVGNHRIEKSFCSGTGNFMLRKWSQIKQGGPLSGSNNFKSDTFEPVGSAAVETVLVEGLLPFCSKPVGPFPSITLTKSSIQVFMPVINPAGFGRPCRRSLFKIVMDDEDMLVGFFVFRLDEIPG